MRISVVLPCKNEQDAIGEVIRGVRSALGEDTEIIVVDGASVDQTVPNALKADSEVMVVQQEGRGKGMAVRTAKRLFTGDVFVLIDSDMTYDPVDIPKVLGPLLTGEADVALGSRLMGNVEIGALSRTNRLGNKILSLLVSLKSGKRIVDSLTGLRAMTKRVVEGIDIQSEGFDLEAELDIKSVKQGFKIVEVPISYRKRVGKAKLRGLRDGVAILWRILRS